MYGSGALPTVSVVIPTRERRDRLARILAPLLDDPAVLEVVVVVDGSCDGSLELLEQVAARNQRVVPVWIEPQGAARARLAGVRRARGDVVLLLDDDVVALPGLVSGHARRHAAREHLVVVGYMPVHLPGRRLPGDFSRWVYAQAYERACRHWDAHPDRLLLTLWAGNLSLRRTDYLALGPAIGGGVEGYHADLEFGVQCLRHGLEGCFDRTLEGSHRYERDAATFARDAYSSGLSLIHAHERHPDVLGSLAPDFPERSVRPFLRPVVLLAARRPVMRRLVDAGIRCAGRLRLFRLESAGAGLLWAIWRRRAADAAAQEARRP